MALQKEESSWTSIAWSPFIPNVSMLSLKIPTLTISDQISEALPVRY